MSGLPLFLARSSCGRGPKVPIRRETKELVISGLGEGHGVSILVNEEQILGYDTNGKYYFRAQPGDVIQAELVGEGCSNTYVWLE